MPANFHIVDFSKLKYLDIEHVGKKAFQIGELKRLGIPIPDGFVIPPFFHLSDDLIKEIYCAYKKISYVLAEPAVNIFTSCSSDKTVAFSNVKGDANVILKIKKIRDHLSKPVAIIVQKNILPKVIGRIATNNLSGVQSDTLINYAKKIQKYFYFPQELTYAVENNKTYIISIVPWTGITDYKRSRKILAKGLSVNSGIAVGVVKLFKNNDFKKIKKNEIAVIPQLNMSICKKIKKTKAIVVDNVFFKTSDKITCGRFLQVPIVYNTKNATKTLPDGHVITVNGTNGEIYRGGLI